jgi:hypothetical protein
MINTSKEAIKNVAASSSTLAQMFMELTNNLNDRFTELADNRKDIKSPTRKFRRHNDTDPMDEDDDEENKKHASADAKPNGTGPPAGGRK